MVVIGVGDGAGGDGGDEDEDGDGSGGEDSDGGGDGDGDDDDNEGLRPCTASYMSSSLITESHHSIHPGTQQQSQKALRHQILIHQILTLLHSFK